MMAVAYEWHNYGKSTIGNASDIERVPIDKLQEFYHKYYQPDNVVLVVAGKFDEAKALGCIGKYFGVIKRPERKLDDTYTEEPAQDGERSVVLRRVGKVGVVGVIYHIPAGPHDDFAALEVLNNMLVSQPSGLLYKSLVENKIANNVTGVAYGWHDPGVLEINAEVDRSKSLEGVRDAMVGILERMQEARLTEEDVERAKRKLVKNRKLLMTDSGRVAITLSDWAAKGDWRLFFLHRDRLKNVTLADVSRVAGRYLKPSNRTVGLYIPSETPQRTEVPETPAVAGLVKDYKGREAVAAGEAFDPTPENIEKRVKRSELPSGVKLALLPKKSRGEIVVANLTLRFGNEDSLKGQTSAIPFLGPLMVRATKTHNRQQLQDELDRLDARLNAHSSLGQITFSIECEKETLPAVLGLLGKVLREPTFPQQDFDELKRQHKDNLEKGLVEPRDLASRALQRKLNPYPENDVRYVPTIEESLTRLQAVTLEQVRKLCTDQLGGQHGEMVLVGDFDPETAPKLVQDMLKDWKAATPYKRITHTARTDIAGSSQSINTPDKANAFYMAGQTLALTDTDPDYAALEIANFIFGGGTLSSRLGNRVRQKEGLSYGVRSQFHADELDRFASFSMFAICNPKVIDKVDQVIAEELDKLLKDGVTADELTEAKKAFLEQLKVQRASDSRVATILSEGLYAGRTCSYYSDLEKKIKALTPDEVNAAFRKHIIPKKLVLMRAGDFKGQ